MVNAELKRLHSPDVADLQNFSPEEADNFRILVQALIGPLGSKGQESFDFVICTPKWIENEVERQGHLFGKAHLVVKEYDYNEIFGAIEKLCNGLSGDSWETIESKLRLYGDWEYEDNRPG
ncbi:MAG TPA: immunity 8 family protein [Anaerolineales bacterium]